MLVRDTRVNGLPVVKIHVVARYLSDQGTSISLSTFGSPLAQSREPGVLASLPAKSYPGVSQTCIDILCIYIPPG